MNRKQQISILNFATVVVLFAAPAVTYQLLQNEPNIPSNRPAKEALEGIRLRSHPEVSLEHFQSKYFFQSPAPQSVEAKAAPGPITTSVVKPSFEVIAMVISSTGRESRITVRKAGASSVLRTGETLDGYTLNSIDPSGKAAFSKGGQVFHLEVSER